MATISAIVLAAGLSSRMGSENKMLMPMGELSIIGHVMQNILSSCVDRVILVSNERSFGVYETMFKDPKLSMVLNPEYKNGMTSSIQLGVRVSMDDMDGYMICLGDQPLISTRIYDQLIDAFDQNISSDPLTIVAPIYYQKMGNPVIFSKKYRDQILAHREPEGCKTIVTRHKDHLYKLPIGSDAVMRDVDTPDDYLQLIEHIQKMSR